MEVKKKIKKLVKSLLYPQKTEGIEQVNYGFMSRRISEDLLSEDLKQEGKTNFTLDGEELQKYRDVYKKLRGKIEVEYLKDKELDEKLWYLICDVFINKNRYKANALNARVDDFVDSTFRPIKEYEVIFVVTGLSVKETPLVVWDVTLETISKENLDGMLYDKLGGILCRTPKETVVEIFSQKVVMKVSMSGNNPGLVVNRAREKAEFVLSIIQTYLNSSISIHDENLLFQLSEHALIREKGSKQWSHSWQRRRSSHGVTIAGDSLALVEKANKHFQAIKNVDDKLAARIKRAIYWIGASIEEEVMDHKVIFLCTALESLLSDIGDQRKGEIITYRMVIVNHLTEGNFPEPFKMMMLYVLRSKIVHGSLIGEVTKSDYLTLQYMTTRTLLNSIDIIEREGIKRYAGFLRILESEENIKLLKSYFERFKGKWPEDIVKILNEVLSVLKRKG